MVVIEEGTTRGFLGQCPGCGTSIPRRGLLVEYETEGGWPQMAAECPRCGDVVHPR